MSKGKLIGPGGVSIKRIMAATNAELMVRAAHMSLTPLVLWLSRRRCGWKPCPIGYFWCVQISETVDEVIIYCPSEESLLLTEQMVQDAVAKPVNAFAVGEDVTAKVKEVLGFGAVVTVRFHWHGVLSTIAPCDVPTCG